MLLSGQDAELELSGREEAIPSPMTCPLGPSRPPTPRIAAVDSCTKSSASEELRVIRRPARCS